MSLASTTLGDSYSAAATLADDNMLASSKLTLKRISLAKAHPPLVDKTQKSSMPHLRGAAIEAHDYHLCATDRYHGRAYSDQVGTGLQPMAIKTEVDLLRNRRTKIIATLGPASQTRDRIEALVRAGANVFRLNMSHGTHDDHRKAYEHVRSIAQAHRVPLAVLADLSGPKIRVGTFTDSDGIALVAGDNVTVTVRDIPGQPGLIPSQYEALARDVSPGDRILLADGVMELTVQAIEGTEVDCVVVQGGQLTDRKGINLPGVDVSAPCLTEKDTDDAAFAIDLGVDYLALSFVRRAADIEALRHLIESRTNPECAPRIIAKIERPEALSHSEEILAATDAVMVARGDLGVELPPEQVPIAQSELTEGARRHNRSLIVATQMLESMIGNARPTRAEVADVSYAVTSGADAIMLSAETASGAHPVEAVEMMDRVARNAEAHMWHRGAFGGLTRREETASPIPFGDAMARATALLSRDLAVKGIMVFSEGGMSAATMSSGRPAAPVVAISSRERTYRRMSLMWGILPVLVDAKALDDPAALARRLSQELQLANEGDYILTVGGFRTDPRANAPTVTLLAV